MKLEKSIITDYLVESIDRKGSFPQTVKQSLKLQQVHIVHACPTIHHGPCCLLSDVTCCRWERHSFGCLVFVMLEQWWTGSYQGLTGVFPLMVGMPLSILEFLICKIYSNN